MKVQQLIARCTMRETAAWQSLWPTVVRAARFPIQQRLRDWRFQALLVDDVLQELALYLMADDLRRLRRFRGNEWPQFRSFLRTVSTRFSLRIVRRWHRTRCRDAELSRNVQPPDRSGPAESELQFAREELEILLSPAERSKLEILIRAASWTDAGEAASLLDTLPSDRTLRHWRQELCRRHGGQL